MANHRKNSLCQKYDEILNFDNHEDLHKWEKTIPRHFAKKRGKRTMSNGYSYDFHCNNKSATPKTGKKAPNYQAFVKRNLKSCNGSILMKKFENGSSTVYIKKCDTKNHFVPEAIPDEIRIAIREKLIDGFSNAQTKKFVLRNFKCFVTRYTMNNVRYKHKIDMAFKTSNNDLISTKAFLGKFHKSFSNIDEIKEMKDLVAVFQTKEMHDRWEKTATICFDSTHKISKYYYDHK